MSFCDQTMDSTMLPRRTEPEDTQTLHDTVLFDTSEDEGEGNFVDALSQSSADRCRFSHLKNVASGKLTIHKHFV